MRTLLSLIFVAMFSYSQACTCLPIKSFCEQVVRGLDWDSSHLIIARAVLVEKVKVDRYRTDAIYQILESYYNPRNLSSVRIRDGNGADCGRTMNPYQKGDELIFVTSVWDDSDAMGQFSICSPPPLVVKGNKVHGHVFQDKEVSLSITKFRDLDCLPNSPSISFYPNPTSSELHIVDIQRTESQPVIQVEVYDMMGKRMMQRRPTIDEVNNGSVMIEVSDFPEGTYFLSLITGQNRRTEPFMVLH